MCVLDAPRVSLDCKHLCTFAGRAVVIVTVVQCWYVRVCGMCGKMVSIPPYDVLG